MKKLLAVIAIALVAAAAVWVIMQVQLANRLATVPELLPTTTLMLAHVPDFHGTRKQWHESDIYQIWREPAVQAWSREPLARLPKDRGGRKTLEEFLQLDPKHGFIALTALENNEPKLIGGFHFEPAPEEARKFIEQWQAEWWPKTGETKRETIVYEQHKIETVSVSHFVFASVYHNHWFFASNDLAALKALLDRADRRREKMGVSLGENESFSAALKHLPGEYGGMIFLDPRPFVEKLMPVVAMTGQSLPMNQLERLKQVRSMAATLGFDRGKMRETDFLAMPRVGTEEKLARRSLAAAGANTFLYSASRIHWPENIFSTSTPAAVGLPAILQQLTEALTARGMALNDLRAAFGEEVEIVGDWPADARWPTLQATLPVRDAARARKIAEALTSVELAGAAWTRREKDGATIYSVQPFGGFVPLSPAIAISDKMMFAGSDVAAVEAAVTTVERPGGELEKSAIFVEAARQVPAAGSAFNYVDTRLLFERADAAVRPLLLMSATFYPAVGKNIDPTKLPPPEAIAKHLSPIVMSQRYETDGYVTESVGSVTFRQATIGLACLVGGAFIYLQEGLKRGGLSQPNLANPVPAAATPTPIASPF
jgi:hypothetical protein